MFQNLTLTSHEKFAFSAIQFVMIKPEKRERKLGIVRSGHAIKETTTIFSGNTILAAKGALTHRPQHLTPSYCKMADRVWMKVIAAPEKLC